MRYTKARKIAAVGLVATAGMLVGAAPSGAQDGSGSDATIQMKIKGKHPFFSGPETVAQGATLTIENTTRPKQIGPHTFTLLEPDLLPATKPERKACSRFRVEFCQDILKAHKANPETGDVKEPAPDAGKKGWDTMFGSKGDSWFAGAKGATHSRKVTAAAGTTLTYFCAIHPKMQGSIEVVE
jgi:hypothetical protein